jgi:hypothetical protein
VRGDVFNTINTLKADPYMPYHDPARPFVRAWFSASNGARIHSFTSMLCKENQEQLERERGLCILYTHFGTPGFVERGGNGMVDQEVARLLTMLSRRNGWFAPVSEILDFLGGGDPQALRTSDRMVRSARRLIHA